MTGTGAGAIVSQFDPAARARPRRATRSLRRRGPPVGPTRAARTAGEKLETAYPPRRAAAAQMRRTLRAYLSGQALDAKAVFDVVLAADEAFINAVGHAGAVGDAIRVSASVSKSEVSVEVQDGGAGFTYLRSHQRSIPDVRRPDGRGVFLIESLMDEVSVSSGARGTVVRMVRHLA